MSNTILQIALDARKMSKGILEKIQNKAKKENFVTRQQTK
jgi:hypothetical protein